MHVFLDSAPENMTPELALDAERVLEERWDGWLRPLATADALGRFLDAWRSADRNGIWGHVSEVGDVLVCSRTDDEMPADEFLLAEVLDDGTRLYDLTGWAWVTADQ